MRVDRARTFPEACYDAVGGSPIRALGLAIRIERWKLIAEFELDPLPDERLPLEVRHARDRAVRQAA